MFCGMRTRCDKEGEVGKGHLIFLTVNAVRPV